MSRGDTSLIRRLVPTKIMFDLYRVGNTNQLEHNSRSPCNTPFFSNGYIEFESGAITTKLLRNDPKTLLVDFTSFCTKGHVTFETVVFTLDNFIKQLESIIDRKTDFIYVDVNVSTDWTKEYDCPSYGSCPKKEICKNINKNSSYYKGSSTCVIQFNLNQVKKALAVYHGIEEEEGGFGMKGSFGKLFSGIEMGISKDHRIKSTLTGIVVQNPENGKWYAYDPATRTRKDMLNLKFGDFPIALIPVKSLTVGRLTKRDGKYFWVQSINNDNTFTGVNAMTGAVETYVMNESLIPGLNFCTEVVAFDGKTLLDPNSKENMGGNLLTAMVMMQMMSSDKAEFSLDDINDDSFSGLGMFLPLLMTSKGGNLGITNPDGTPNIMAMMMIANGGDGNMNDIMKFHLLSSLLSGGNVANPFGDFMNGFAPNAAAPKAEEAPEGNYVCSKCGKKYSDPAVHFCTACGGKVVVSGTTCSNCGALIMDGAKFCHVCGKPVGPATCPKCGKEVPEGAKFCPSCGTDLAPAPAPAPTPAPEPAPAPAPAPEK